jgi:hypothetical protein
MKKIMVLAGVAAAAFGAMKLLKNKDNDEFAAPYNPPTSYSPEPHV